jgi:hypothetical protein
MAATLGEVRAALASVLEDALPAWNIYRLPPDDVQAPAIILGGFQVDVATFGDTTARVSADLQLVVSRRHVDQVHALDDLLSPTSDQSLFALFNDDPTLGERIGYCSVSGAGDYRELVVADVGYYAATITLSVML